MKTHLTTKTTPLALLAICGVTYGILIPSLGFYVDDWHHLYFGYTRGLPGLWQLFLYDSRPFAAYFYLAGFKILGFSPLPWHLLAFALRSLTVIAAWLCLGQVWPAHRREVAWTGVLFAVYPLFKQGPLAVAYSLHWAGYLLYALSLWAMLKAMRQPRRFWPFTGLSLLAQGSHLLLLEYYAGLELVRPLLLWSLFSEMVSPRFERFKRVLKTWWPYLLVLAVFALYRVYWIPRPEPGFERNTLVLVYALLDAPVSTLVHLIQGAWQDSLVVLFTTWGKALNPALFEITSPANVIGLLVMILAAIALFVYLDRLRFNDQEVAGNPPGWVRTALLVGLALVLLGPLPAWLTDQFITTDNPLWSDRYGLAAMLGASLVVVASLEGLVGNARYRLAVFCALVGLSVGWHLLNANDYRRAWIKQSNFYWQLAWRAPYIKPDTALLSSGEIFSNMTEVSTSFALSVLYPKEDDSLEVDYWFYSLSRRFSDRMEELLQGMPLRYQRNFARFLGRSQDSLVIFYEPEHYECLWVLGPEGSDIRALPDITRQAAAISDLARIHAAAPKADTVPREIFGPEPAHTWCYYYESADLARQQGDWDQVVALWGQAAENGYAPGNGVEFLPFVEGFAHLGDWDTAAEMTAQAEVSARVMAPVLCATWRKIEAETRPSSQRQEALQAVYEELRCP